MWPFRKKPALPPPDDIVHGDDHAWFSTDWNEWQFEIDGIEFSLSGRAFGMQAFNWGRKALADAHTLEAEIDQHVLKALGGWECNAASRHLFSISLDDYPTKQEFDLCFVGEESWADFGVNVILCDGQIVGSHGGD